MPFDLQPSLTGERLELRPLRPDDLPALYAVASDPLIWRQHPHANRHREEVFRGFFLEALQFGGALLVMDRTDGKVIGSSRFHGFDEAASEVEIGWTFLARSHWGGIFNAELKRLMLAHAFGYVKRVILVVGAQNRRSQRAVEKIGGRRAGSRRNAAGEDDLVYEIMAAMPYGGMRARD
jgi:RimJ/RimL family protein N-acetyltransferase